MSHRNRTQQTFIKGKDIAAQNIQAIPLSKMFLPRCQRMVKHPETVEEIVNHFDPGKLGVLIVNRRPNGSYAVIEGQHRLLALRRLGFKAANCIVFTGMTEQQEANFFKHQRDNTHALSSKDMFKAGIIEGDEVDNTIQQIIVQNGFYVEVGGTGTKIDAIASLKKIVKIFNYSVLDYTLAYAGTTWPGNKKAISREMLAALAEFASRFKDQVPVEQFAKRMKDYNPEDLVSTIRQTNSTILTRGIFAKDSRYNACVVLVKYYNRGLGSTSKMRLHMIYGEA